MLLEVFFCEQSEISENFDNKVSDKCLINRSIVEFPYKPDKLITISDLVNRKHFGELAIRIINENLSDLRKTAKKLELPFIKKGL